MAYLYFSSITESSFRVRLRDLDTNYSRSGRWASFELYRGSTYIDYGIVDIPAYASQSDYVIFSGLDADTKYTVECTIGGITGTSNVYLDDYVWTDYAALSTPSPDVHDYSYTWIDFDWGRVSGATGYDWELREGTTRIASGSTSNTYVLIDDLTPGVQYRFRALAYNSSGESSWSSYYTQRTRDLYYPSFSIYDNTETTITLLIYEEDDVDRYRVYVDGSYEGYVSSTSNTGYKVYTITGLTAGRNYSIRVSTTVDGYESSQSPAIDYYTLYPYPNTYVGTLTNNSAAVSWDSVSGATRYYVYLNGVSQGYVTSRTYTFTNLSPGTKYNFYVSAYNGYTYSNSGLVITEFTTIDKVRPANWAWEYTIASGQPFYTQSGSTVYIMRASHWNAFTARINLFRVYKYLSNYSFTTAVTSHTESQIRACVNQAITAINAMGFSQSSVSSGGDVAASTFTTMRDNLNSIT